jgi:hypothetical protein
VHGRFDGLAPSGLQGLNPATLTALSPTTYQTAGIETRLSQIVGYDGQLGNATAGLDAAHLRWFAFAGPETLDNGLALVLHLGPRPRTRLPPSTCRRTGRSSWAATSTCSGASGHRDPYTACSKSAYICSAGGVTNGRNCE